MQERRGEISTLTDAQKFNAAVRRQGPDLGVGPRKPSDAPPPKGETMIQQTNRVLDRAISRSKDAGHIARLRGFKELLKKGVSPDKIRGVQAEQAAQKKMLERYSGVRVVNQKDPAQVAELQMEAAVSNSGVRLSAPRAVTDRNLMAQDINAHGRSFLGPDGRPVQQIGLLHTNTNTGHTLLSLRTSARGSPGKGTGVVSFPYQTRTEALRGLESMQIRGRGLPTVEGARNVSAALTSQFRGMGVVKPQDILVVQPGVPQ